MKKEVKKIFKRINSQKFAVMASFDGDYPYCNLMSFYLIENLKTIYIATSKKSHKYQNMIKHRKVSLLVDNTSNKLENIKESYAITIIGDVDEVNPKKQNAIKNEYLKKYPLLKKFVNDNETILIKINIKKYICVDNFDHVSEIIID